MLYTKKDKSREAEPKRKLSKEILQYRSEFRRDYARLIHSPSFRRLQGKTQVFPWAETDFFRNRLTHSLEVSQIAKTIAMKLNCSKFFIKHRYKIDTDLVEFAALSHDIGHTPFGHIGELALNQNMKQDGGFESNAQTLRLLAKTEKREIIPNNRIGLNLTYRSYAAILKYDEEIKYSDENKKLKKGYYSTEKELVNKIKLNVVGTDKPKAKFKTIECSIMDIADDIAYSTYDLEDALKGGFITLFDCIFLDDKLILKIKNELDDKYSEEEINFTMLEIFQNLFTQTEVRRIKLDKNNYRSLQYFFKRVYQTSIQTAQDGHLRTDFTSDLVNDFIKNVKFKLNKNYPVLSEVYFLPDMERKVKILKKFVYCFLVKTPRFRIFDKRGMYIIDFIFQKLTEPGGDDLLPSDIKLVYDIVPLEEKKRVICDYISNMTDRYAIEFFGRFNSSDPESIFKGL